MTVWNLSLDSLGKAWMPGPLGSHDWQTRGGRFRGKLPVAWILQLLFADAAGL